MFLIFLGTLRNHCRHGFEFFAKYFTLLFISMNEESFESFKKRSQTWFFKEGAYYCYCAYVLRIARYSDFLWVLPSNTGIFLRGLKLYGEAELTKCFWYLKRKLGVTMDFSEIIKLQFRKKSHTLLYILAFFRDITAQ